MKRKLVLIFIFFAFVGVSSNAQASNDGQRLVGTWACCCGEFILIFNPNGSGTATGLGDAPLSSVNFNWGFSVASGRLRIVFNFPPRPANIPVRDWVEDLRAIREEFPTDYVFLSPDGRRMIYGADVFQRR